MPEEKQLNLNLDIKYDASLSDFAGPGWVTIVDAVRQFHVGMIQQLYLFGESGTGKSHLLSAICESLIDMGRSAITLSMSDLLYTNVEVLASLEAFDVIAIDDIGVIEKSAQWQEAMFHLINRSKEENFQLLFAGNKPAGELPFGFFDLVTRLSQAPSFKVPDGQNVADRQAMLDSVLRRRGWQLDERIIEYLLEEGPYRIGEMMAVLNYIQPMFSNLARNHISKATINEAKKIIDEQSLLVELEGIHEDVIADTQALSFDDNIAFDF
ncbi:DnaA/Hda family protein [Psychrobacter sp. HD31]|uniref:DnaA ATPase domain-containing protein n=1 Tax=Psychrobacter sp. HD31 TaxID=3112003 RepID=UPI003DA55CCF